MSTLMRASRGAIGLLLPALIAVHWTGVAAIAEEPPAKLITREFFSGSFSMSVPTWYEDQSSDTSKPGMAVFAFATAARADGSRGMIQITLLDLKEAAGHDGDEHARQITSDELLRKMLTGVQRRRDTWTQGPITQVRLGSLDTARATWSGRMGPAEMAGVMYAGRSEDTAFALHTQDLEPYAASYLAAGDAALRSFQLHPGRKHAPNTGAALDASQPGIREPDTSGQTPGPRK